MTQYEPGAYWESLLEGEFNESGVGYPGLARSINLAMYRTLHVSVVRALKLTGAPAAPERVLDMGSGTGIWIDFWRRRGAAHITGVDLTRSSIERLRRQWPEHDFLQADLGEVSIELPKDQDVVSAMSVLLHIVDDARFRQAFVNLASALRPNGILILVEPVVVHRWWGPAFGAEANSKARPLADYSRALREAGLDLQLLQPATALLSNVIDARSAMAFRLLQAYWDLVVMRGIGQRERLGAVVAAILGPTDRLATRILRTGPSAKVLVARRMR